MSEIRLYIICAVHRRAVKARRVEVPEEQQPEGQQQLGEEQVSKLLCCNVNMSMIIFETEYVSRAYHKGGKICKSSNRAE